MDAKDRQLDTNDPKQGTSLAAVAGISTPLFVTAFIASATPIFPAKYSSVYPTSSVHFLYACSCSPGSYFHDNSSCVQCATDLTGHVLRQRCSHCPFVYGGVFSQATTFVALFVDHNTLNPVPIVGVVHHVFSLFFGGQDCEENEVQS